MVSASSARARAAHSWAPICSKVSIGSVSAATVLLGDRPLELETWLNRRQELGQDRHDEVWEGDYHVVPGPSAEHAMVDSQLARLLWPRAEQAGLLMSTAFNLGEPEGYRVSDGGVHRDRPGGVFVATAAMVVEIVSPGDETLAKLDFYARRAVDEVLVADPQLRIVRVWQLVVGPNWPGGALRRDRPQRPAQRRRRDTRRRTRLVALTVERMSALQPSA